MNSQVSLSAGQLLVEVDLPERILRKSIDKQLYHGYTISMKTAISLPDALYADAEETAKSMGIPRSQLFAKALEEYINNHKKERITEKLNEVYSNISITEESQISVASLHALREMTKNDSW
jgi:uncharacterized protein YbcI